MDVVIHVRTQEDVGKLKDVLNGFEAKSVCLYTKQEWCRREGVSLLGRVFRRFHQVLYVYNARDRITAFIYRPWRVAITDRGYYNTMYNGCLNRVNSKLKVVIDSREIEVIVDNW